MTPPPVRASATGMLADLAGLGADRRRGGFSRHLFQPAELDLRDWFSSAATARGLDVETDRNTNLWAWWGTPGTGDRQAVVTGSHLDSVPGGGAFDGPLGVVSALAALDALRANGFQPSRPIGVAVFAEEEGGRFGVPCLGSRLLSGAIDPDAARALTDQDGVSLAEAAASAGADPAHLGADRDRLAHIGAFVELHVEQGRGLVELAAPVGVAGSILAHGRWRFTFTGQGNHAGTTSMTDRHDPMLPAAALVRAARRAGSGGARATVGRLVPNPGGTNVIASTVDVWLDARADDDERTRAVVAEVSSAAAAAAAEEGCTVTVTEESYGDTVHFDPVLRDRLAETLGGVPVLPTGAGHDAGILAAHLPTGMVFVRNPTGVSHAPAEHAEPGDCDAGVAALATVLRRLAG